MANFIEGHFELELEGSDLAKSNFESIDSRVELVTRLRGAQN